MRCWGGREFDCEVGRGPVGRGEFEAGRGALPEGAGRGPFGRAALLGATGRGALLPVPGGRGVVGRGEVDDVGADGLGVVEDDAGRGFAAELPVEPAGFGFTLSVFVSS